MRPAAAEDGTMHAVVLIAAARCAGAARGALAQDAPADVAGQRPVPG
jgi:hypothetical protein